MIECKNQILIALSILLLSLGLAGQAHADRFVTNSSLNSADGHDCYPFGLAHNELVTVFSCGLEFEPVSWPSPSEVFDQTPNAFTQCDGHVDGRKYWRTNADIYLTDNYTGLQWIVPAGTIADGASFPQPLRRLWTDRWSGLHPVDSDNVVPFALVAGFFHDYYMCRIVRANDANSDFAQADLALKPYETPGCVHQMFEHALMGFYNTPLIARVSVGTVALTGWMRGAGRPETCRYLMASDGRPRVFWQSDKRHSPNDFPGMARRAWRWSRQGASSNSTGAASAINSLGQWSARQADKLARRLNVGVGETD